MAKVFLSYSHKDQEFASRLADALKKSGVEVLLDKEEIRVGENFILRISETFQEVDAVIPLITPNYVGSRWAQEEIATWRLYELTSGKPRIFPVLVEEAELPSSLASYVYIDARSAPVEATSARLVSILRPPKTPAAKARKQKEESLLQESAYHVDKLKEEFSRGNLTLFCGAGVSIEAGIPGWSVLVKTLIMSLFKREASEILGSREVGSQLAEIYQNSFGLSPLVIAQYLKNGLGTGFRDAVRSALYIGEPTSSPLIDAICELCRPQRERRSLHSMVSFNFDNLVEENLDRKRIKYRAIYKEGQRCLPSEIPIYHVHGFLPRAGGLDNGHDLVFSEDAYHSQFIDPFSWANLTQLNHLNQNTCLFIGLSMTDPNLRRLLDVSMRKNPSKALNHFLVKRRYQEADLIKSLRASGLKGEEQTHARDLVRMAEVLEEQDANNLGMNVMWVNDFSEVSGLLLNLVAD
jgi:hypothetical protein